MKRILFGLALVSLVVTGITSVQAADIDSARFLRTIGVVEGRGGDLALDKSIARSEMLKILGKIASEDATPHAYYACFDDITVDAWYSGYACWARNQNVVRGIGATENLAPARPVSHAEAVKMVVKTFYIGETDEELGDQQWYETYVKAAIEKNLIGADIYDKLALPMTRGEVFDLVYKAMVVKESGVASYSETAGQAFPQVYGKKVNTEKSIVLTEGQQKVKNIVKSQLAFGFKPQTQKTNGSLHLDIKDQEGKGTDHLGLDLTLVSSKKTTGTDTTLAATDADMTVQAKVDAFLSNKKVKGTFNVKTHIMLSGTGMLFARLDDASVENLEADEDIKAMIDQGVAIAKIYTGKWYSVQLKDYLGTESLSLSNEDVAKAIIGSWIDTKLDTYLAQLQIQTAAEGSLDVLTIKLTPEAIAHLARFAAKQNPENYNKYGFMDEFQKTAKNIQPVIDHLTLTLKASSQTQLMTFMNLLFSDWNFIPNPETTEPAVNAQMSFTSNMTYPEIINIVFPTDAIDMTGFAPSFLPNN